MTAATRHLAVVPPTTLADDPDAAFTVTTWPMPDRDAGTHVAHFAVLPGAMLAALDALFPLADDLPFLTGEMAAGDRWAEWCEPADDVEPRALHVTLAATDDRQAARIGAALAGIVTAAVGAAVAWTVTTDRWDAPVPNPGADHAPSRPTTTPEVTR